jgi:predicted nucleotidyltransferase
MANRACNASFQKSQLDVKQLSPKQRELVSSLAKRRTIRGSGPSCSGSHARGRAQPGSDIDLGLLYSEAASIQSIRELADGVNDAADPVVTDFYGWGHGSTVGRLTIGGQRVDFVHFSLST